MNFWSFLVVALAIEAFFAPVAKIVALWRYGK